MQVCNTFSETDVGVCESATSETEVGMCKSVALSQF